MATVSERRREWLHERERLERLLKRDRDNTGWPLSPEAKDNLRLDIAECDRVLARLSHETGGND